MEAEQSRHALSSGKWKMNNIAALRPILDEDKDLILKWRNSPDVAPYMYTDHQISEPEHNQWFDSIRSDLRREYWIIESDSNDRRFLDNLFHPVKIESVNFVWLPDGSKLTRVVLTKNSKGIDEKRLETIKMISMAVRKIDLIIEFI